VLALPQALLQEQAHWGLLLLLLGLLLVLLLVELHLQLAGLPLLLVL
jgi:hypothetical protein